MKQFKVLLLSLTALFVLLFLFSLIIPANTVVSRSIDINCSKEKLHQNISNLNQWRYWNTAIQAADSTTGSVVIDTTRQTITVSNTTLNLSRINDSTYNIDIKNTKGETMLSTLRLYQSDSIQTLNWKYYFHTKWYPWEKFRSMFYDKIFGAVLDSNLTALKKFCEETTGNN